jgi:hypothetical protein
MAFRHRKDRNTSAGRPRVRVRVRVRVRKGATGGVVDNNG